jgi:hypothetical protein
VRQWRGHRGIVPSAAPGSRRRERLPALAHHEQVRPAFELEVGRITRRPARCRSA